MEKNANQELELTYAAKAYENPIAILTDGSWMKRGHMSLFGIVAVIVGRTGQLIDCVIKLRTAKGVDFGKSNKKAKNTETMRTVTTRVLSQPRRFTWENGSDGYGYENLCQERILIVKRCCIRGARLISMNGLTEG